MNLNKLNHQNPDMTPLAGKHERIQYIDALRGFTMILVVFYHVSQFCWHVCGKGISIQDFLVQVRMPMFFFISGYRIAMASIIAIRYQVGATAAPVAPVIPAALTSSRSQR